MDLQNNATILIHGYAFDHRIWYPLELAFEGHRVTYLSLPGFNLEPVIEPYTIAELAKKYWAHLDDIKREQVNLVGHSMGGYVCVEMMAQQPSRVSSLTLVHSHVFEDSPQKKEGRSDAMNDIITNGREGFATKLITSLFADADKSSSLVKKLIRRGLQYDDNAWFFGMQAMRSRRDHTETLKAAQVPVLMLMGEADKSVPVELALKQASLADRTSIHIYPGVGHLGMYENTKQLLVDLIQFFEGPNP
jgi:pimeloyl-ACP methyl ester carboxylesterase